MSPDEKYKQLIEEAKPLARPAVERNIFSICGRGHYENPISDLLAFFIDPSEEHRFDDLFLTSLFEAAGLTPPTGPCDPPPTREECTNQGNRIDLVVEGEDWVLVIENKIRHQVINPLDDYVDHMVERTKNLEGENRHFVILCVREQKPKPTGWHTVTWRSYVDRIKQNFASRLTEPRNMKWQVIMREFLLNIEQECGDEIMDTGRIELVRKNYSTIRDIQAMHAEYLQHLAAEGIKALKEANCSEAYSKQQTWPTAIAVRLHNKLWGKDTNIALVAENDGSLYIRAYVYDIPPSGTLELDALFDRQNYRDRWTELSGRIRVFGDYSNSDERKLFDEVKLLAIRLNSSHHITQQNQPPPHKNNPV